MLTDYCGRLMTPLPARTTTPMTIFNARIAHRPPLTTYRVQLHAGFTFQQLAEQIPHLASLGVSHCYCSPIFRATPGSTHGYDVCDYAEISPELGGEDGLRVLSTALKEHGMGLLLDFVPNHMGVAGDHNRWWVDVLEHGERSRFAPYFDVQWQSLDGHRPRQLFLPLLAEHYGTMLEDQRISLQLAEGRLWFDSGGLRFPARARTYGAVLTALATNSPRSSDLLSLAEAFNLQETKPAEQSAMDLHAEFGRLMDDSAVADAFASYRTHLNGQRGYPSSFDSLDELIQDQHYRLSRWQAGPYGSNYRRFFAIDALAGVRVEVPEVFDSTHARLKQLIADGIVDGLRIDHIDGLRDPEAYLGRLQLDVFPSRESGAPGYVLVEKILAPAETLPLAWAAHGTTGYEFIQQLSLILTDPSGQENLTRVYQRFIGRDQSFETVLAHSKRRVLEELFPSTLNNLASRLQQILVTDRRWRDLTVPELVEAIGAVLAGFTVYRSYRRDEGIDPTDRQQIMDAAARARRNEPRVDRTAIDFVRDCLLGDYPEPAAISDYRAAIQNWAMTVQQYSGAIMAKSAEDTAFYNYNRLLALNEVGGTPEIFSGTPSQFHEINRSRGERFPFGMLTTSTHDTKLSEDARARLYALSAMSDEWSQWVDHWHALNAPHRESVDGEAVPDRDQEYRLYQSLIAVWPLGSVTEGFIDRIKTHLRKAFRESKEHVLPREAESPWLEAGDAFIEAIFADGNQSFRDSFAGAANAVAKAGALTSLTQLVLKFTSPGVPDIYQGNETWQFDLVDPDNRRPVNFTAIAALRNASENALWSTLLAEWPSGALKFKVTAILGQLRKQDRDLFLFGDYVPLAATGELAANVIAFARSHGERRMIVIVSRNVGPLAWPPTGGRWKDTWLDLPSDVPMWTEAFTGQKLSLDSVGVPLDRIFTDLPIAVLMG